MPIKTALMYLAANKFFKKFDCILLNNEKLLAGKQHVRSPSAQWGANERERKSILGTD